VCLCAFLWPVSVRARVGLIREAEWWACQRADGTEVFLWLRTFDWCEGYFDAKDSEERCPKRGRWAALLDSDRPR
jgi:hypothetical protein